MWSFKQLLLIKENQTSGVNELGTFLLMERCKSLALTEIISLICTLAN